MVVAISVVVLLLLMVMLRTVVLPLVAVAFDLLTAAATLGILSLLFVGDNPPLGGLGYLDPVTIIEAFAAVFGISIFYEVQLLARTREAFLETRRPARRAAHRAAGRRPRPSTGAAIAGVVAIVPFALSDIIVVRELGVAMAVALLLDAFIVRPVLLPAAVEVLGRWSWWPTSRHAPPGARGRRRRPRPRRRSCRPRRWPGARHDRPDGQRPGEPRRPTSASTRSSTARSGPRPRCARSTRRPSTASSGRWPWPGSSTRSTSPSSRWRRRASASWRTRSSRTTSPRSSSSTTSRTRSPSAWSTRTRSAGIQYVAEPIGVLLALLPITNPTSTALFKAIVAAKTRNAVIFRPSARAARCASRAIDLLQEAGEAVGLPPDALQVVPDPTLDVSQYLFHHPGVDLIWTTGGPKAVAATNEAGKPCISVGPGNAPVYLHRSADVSMAVVDVLISKTFDASVICPAEQMLVVDDAIHDEVMAELERMGARVLSPADVDALAAVAFDEDGRARMEALGRSCLDLGALAGFGVGRRGRRSSSRRCPPTSRSWPRTRSCARSSCRCSASCARPRSTTRSPPASSSPSTAASATRPGSTRTTTRSSSATPSASAPGGCSSTRRRRWARWAASTTR